MLLARRPTYKAGFAENGNWCLALRNIRAPVARLKHFEEIRQFNRRAERRQPERSDFGWFAKRFGASPATAINFNLARINLRLMEAPAARP
jgi:hypothetical protein